MGITHSVLSIALALVCVLAAAAEFTSQPAVADTMDRLGATRIIPVAVAAKMLAAIGLLVGLALPQVGIAAAWGLTAFFVLAIGAHLRVKDSLTDTAGAMVLASFSAITLATGLAG